MEISMHTSANRSDMAYTHVAFSPIYKPYVTKMKMKKGKLTTSSADPINPYFKTQSSINVDISCFHVSGRAKQHVGLNIRRRYKPLIIN